MSTDIKLSKTQISKIIQSGGFAGSWLANLGKKALENVVISLTRDNLSGLVSNLTLNAINKLKKKQVERSYKIRERIYFIYSE